MYLLERKSTKCCIISSSVVNRTEPLVIAGIDEYDVLCYHVVWMGAAEIVSLFTGVISTQTVS